MNERDHGQDPRGASEDDGFDVALERAVRRMLDAEAPADLRERVIARIVRGGEGPAAPASRRGAKGSDPRSRDVASAAGWRHAFVPVAALAAVVLAAVLLLPRSETPSGTPSGTPPHAQSAVSRRAAPAARAAGPDRETPGTATRSGPGVSDAEITGVSDAASTGRVRPVARPASPTRRERIVGAASPTEADDDQSFEIAALERPPSIALAGIQTPRQTPLGTIGPSPLTVAALEVNALPDVPPERRQE